MLHEWNDWKVRQPKEDSLLPTIGADMLCRRPKGVLTSFRGTYLAALANVIEAHMNSDSVYLWILPAFHAAGWTYPYAITAAAAGQVCLRSVGDYTPIWDALEKERVTVSRSYS